MRMHYLTYVFIPKDADIESAVAQALEPFSEDLEVQPWKRYLHAAEVAAMAKHYGVPKTNLLKLADHMPSWTSGKGGVDATGLFAMHTYNPDGKWDWYEIGGRWDRLLRGNTMLAETLLRSPNLMKLLPHDFLTPDGEWRQVETFVSTSWLNGRFERVNENDWCRQFRSALAMYAKHRVVCIDRHS